MENAVDAIKMAFGIFVFVMALSLAISVVGQVRATSDVIFHVTDKTEFYEYVTEGDVSAEDRIVGMETIIPTIHRYAKENIAVSIYDENGNPIVRYDTWTEGIMGSWDDILKNKGKDDALNATYEQVKARLGRVQNIVNDTLNEHNEFNLTKTIENFYGVTNNSNKNIKHRSTMGA